MMVFFCFWTGFSMRMDHHSCMSRHPVASWFFCGDTPGGMFLCT